MDTTKPHSHLITDGIRLGLKLGLILSFLYICIILVATFSDRLYANGMPFSWYLSFSGGTLAIGTIFGVIPAMIIGMATGWLIAFAIERFQTKLSLVTALLLGLFISVGIAILLNMLLFPKNPSDVYTYRTYLQIPSIIYVMGGGYTAVRLFITTNTTRNASDPTKMSNDSSG